MSIWVEESEKVSWSATKSGEEIRLLRRSENPPYREGGDIQVEYKEYNLPWEEADTLAREIIGLTGTEV